MYEHYRVPLAPRHVFVRRLLKSCAIAVGVVLVSLLAGTAGYHFTEGLPWLDAALNASMILTGMGPVDKVETTGGKVFAILFSLYSGVTFLTMMAVVLAPVVHRFLHKLHLQADRS
jgi:hypothetical protein